MRVSFYWPARRDLNSRSPESESVALSSCATGGYLAAISGYRCIIHAFETFIKWLAENEENKVYHMIDTKRQVERDDNRCKAAHLRQTADIELAHEPDDNKYQYSGKCALDQKTERQTIDQAAHNRIYLIEIARADKCEGAYPIDDIQGV